METHAFDSEQQPDGVGVELQAQIEASAARHLGALVGSRHVEVFVTCDG